MLVAYAPDGTILATLGALTVDGELVEPAPDAMQVEGAAGVATWPEELGARVHSYRAEVVDGRLVALIARANGRRRMRPGME